MRVESNPAFLFGWRIESGGLDVILTPLVVDLTCQSLAPHVIVFFFFTSLPYPSSSALLAARPSPPHPLPSPHHAGLPPHCRHTVTQAPPRRIGRAVLRHHCPTTTSAPPLPSPHRVGLPPRCLYTVMQTPPRRIGRAMLRHLRPTTTPAARCSAPAWADELLTCRLLASTVLPATSHPFLRARAAPMAGVAPLTRLRSCASHLPLVSALATCSHGSLPPLRPEPHPSSLSCIVHLRGHAASTDCHGRPSPEVPSTQCGPHGRTGDVREVGQIVSFD